MDIEQFNQLSATEAAAILRPCAHMASWIETLVEQRPYPDLDALYHTSAQQAQGWQWDEIATALAQHPRIGEKTAEVELSEKEQQFSRREQGQVQPDVALQDALYQGNVAYEHRFGHIFLIRAAGRSGEEMLDELQRRLKNTPEQEQQEVKQQLAEITQIRLKQEIQ